MTVLWLKHNISSINYVDSQPLRPERSVCVEAEVQRKNPTPTLTTDVSIPFIFE